MKIQCLFLITVALSSLWISGSSQAQQQGQGRPIVRIIYFYPKDRSPQVDIDAKVDKLVKDVQQVYAGLMAAHGFGRKTFLFETDAAGKAVVHHVKGKFEDAYYHNQAGKVWDESAERFDLSKNIYLAFLDVSTELLDGFACGYGGFRGSFAGSVLIPASGGCFDGAYGVDVTAHELGHSFGLAHDFRTDTAAERIFLNTDDVMITSYCAAEWLDAHAAFNTGTTAFSHDTTAKLLPPNLAAAPNTFSLRFEVTDPDGLHQVQLLIPKSDGDLLLRDCKGLNGAADSTVEFVTVLSPKASTVSLRYIDTHGNHSTQAYPIDVASMSPTRDLSSPDSGLVAYWTFNEKDGNITSDLSGNGHDGTLIGDPEWVDGYFEGGLEFDQDRDEVNVPYHKSLNPESFTVCAWAKLEPGSSGYRAVVSSRDDFPPRGYILYASPNNTWEFWIGTGNRWSNTGGPAANPGRWDHLAAVYADGIQEFYVNGQFVGSVLSEFSVNQSQELLIGAGANEVYSHAYHFKGKIDHVYLYDRALTEAEIALVMNGDPIAMEQFGQIAEDVNGDGVVNIQDLVLVASHLGKAGQNAADVNADGIVDIRDLVKVAGAL